MKIPVTETTSAEGSVTFAELQKAFHEKQLIDSFLNHINNLIFVADSNDRFVYINDTVTKRYGYTREQLLSMGIGDIDILFNPERSEDYWELFERDKQIQIHSVHKDAYGNLYPVIINIYNIRHNGQVYNVGIVDDESYVQKLLDAQDGFVILTDGKELIMSNIKMLNFFGYSDFLSFKKEHKCICDFFIDEPGFIKESPEWVQEVRNTQHNNAKVKISKPDTDADHVFLVRASPFEEGRYLVIFTDITELERYEYLSMTDGLTLLYNRRHFNQMLPSEMRRAKREKKKLAFIMLDIDFFKQYNDYYGHLKGDDVLAEIAHIMQKHFNRASDLCFRLGGEEFGIVCTVTSKEEVRQQAEQMRTAFENLHIEHLKSNISSYVTVSIGIALYDGKETFESLYSKADAELYKAKETGRNCVSFTPYC